MRAPSGFFVGVLLGVALGVAGTLALSSHDGRDGGSSAETNAADRTERPPEPEATLRAQATPPPDTAAPPLAGEDAGPEKRADAVEPQPAPEAVYLEKLTEVRAQLKAIRTAEPGAAAVDELVKAFRALMGHSDPKVARLGARALVALAGSGKLSDESVTTLAKEFETLEAGAPARAGLAGAVALAWARDDRLAGWFDRLPAEEEPEVRATVVEALDESASDAYREYLLRLSRTELDTDVLEHAWHEDPITVAMTKRFAPRLIEAVEPRVEAGGLPPVVRGRALFAVGLAAVFEQVAAAAAIGRMIDDEADGGVRAYGLAVLEAIEREEANVQTLDRLWAQHRRTFGEK